MDRLFFSLLTLALQWFRPRYNAQLQLLQAQIRILRSRIDVCAVLRHHRITFCGHSSRLDAPQSLLM